MIWKLRFVRKRRLTDASGLRQKKRERISGRTVWRNGFWMRIWMRKNKEKKWQEQKNRQVIYERKKEDKYEHYL